MRFNNEERNNDMSKDDRNNKVRAVLEQATEPLGPTEIARRINEPWCMAGGYPQSSIITPVLRKLGIRGNFSGKYKLRPNNQGNSAASLPSLE